MGIQSVALLACFCWISQKERASGKLPIWLLEEPESYLHPQLASQSESLIKQLCNDAQVVYTTHSLAFVPQNPAKVIGLNIKDKWTRSLRFKTYHEATAALRASLGVKFSDFYNFSEYNILCEGQTDRQYIENLISLIKRSSELSSKFPNLTKPELSVHDYGGVSGLEGFLKATYSFIQSERKCVVILDGDEAGNKTRKALTSFFGNKQISFESNKDYIIVRDRFSIEGLLPDDWLFKLHEEHAGWFEDFSKDASGAILPFKLKDSRKESVMAWFFEHVSNANFDAWSEHWEPILEILNNRFE